MGVKSISTPGGGRGRGKGSQLSISQDGFSLSCLSDHFKALDFPFFLEVKLKSILIKA